MLIRCGNSNGDSNLVQKRKEKGIVDCLLCAKEIKNEKWDLWHVV